MNATLAYLDDSLAVLDFAHSPEDAVNGNPYNCSFSLRIVSGEFSGLAPCEYDIKAFRQFVRELEEMYQFRRTTVELNDICYGSKVVFTIDRTGHITVKGNIHGEGLAHSLKFEFLVDQTVLPTFLRELHLLIR